MLRILVAFVLVIATVQCASACTPVSGGCPHHKQTPTPSCTHEIVPAPVAQHVLVSVSFSVETLEMPETGFAIVAFEPVVSDGVNPSPPFSPRI